ncbi:hypothetical protein V7S43_015215 [Phytophthora oleae]|uniref:RxLR effector protein n=1 Tax=Phytophthora oleae TaxID=2107226 RepID=A0ABD3F489_9STRA
MQLQHVVVVAAAALLASSDGLQVVPNSAKSTSLRVPAETRYQPYVEGKTDRFLVTEAKNDAVTKAPTGYEFSTLQEEDNDMLQEEVHEGSESSSADGSGEDERLFGRRKKKRKRKKNKATETPTPTPTATPAGNATATPEPGATPVPTARTPSPTTEEPEGFEAFIAWFNRRIGD